MKRYKAPLGFEFGGTAPQQDKGFDEAELVRRLSLPENVKRWNQWLPEVDASSYAKIGSGFLKPGTFKALAPIPELATAAENEFNAVRGELMYKLRKERAQQNNTNGRTQPQISDKR